MPMLIFQQSMTKIKDDIPWILLLNNDMIFIKETICKLVNNQILMYILKLKQSANTVDIRL